MKFYFTQTQRSIHTYHNIRSIYNETFSILGFITRKIPTIILYILTAIVRSYNLNHRIMAT